MGIDMGHPNPVPLVLRLEPVTQRADQAGRGVSRLEGEGRLGRRSVAGVGWLGLAGGNGGVVLTGLALAAVFLRGPVLLPALPPRVELRRPLFEVEGQTAAGDGEMVPAG